MIAPMNTAPIRAARHAPSQSGGSGGSFMLVLVGCAGDGTRRGMLGAKDRGHAVLFRH
jgi:hypothetical protein